MTCSTCGKAVADGSGFCSGCGAAIVLATAAAAGVGAAPAPGTKPCPYCGEQILQTAIKCRFCSTDLTAPRQQQGGVVVTGPAAGTGQAPSIVIQNVQAAQPSFVPGQQVKNPGIAMLLSIIFPGGGQFYNGHIGKGILILCTSWLILPWVYGIFDAYSSANRINRVGF